MNTRPTTIRLQEYTRNELGKIADSKGKKVGAYIREVLEEENTQSGESQKDLFLEKAPLFLSRINMPHIVLHVKLREELIF